MEKTSEAGTKEASSTPSISSRTSSRTRMAGQPHLPPSGNLSDLEAIIQQSPVVQAQLSLRKAINRSPIVQAQLDLQAAANRSPVVQSTARLAEAINLSPRVAAQRRMAALYSTRTHTADSGEESGLGADDWSTPLHTGLADEAGTLQCATKSEGRPQAHPGSSGDPNHTGLPDHLKAGVENLSGLSMDDVKVHYNSSQPAQLQALAYAQGNDIHIAPGQERHLPHEAWHVVQQKQGRVQSTRQLKGIGINDNASLEKEADAMGQGALQCGASIGYPDIKSQPSRPVTTTNIIQRTSPFSKWFIQNVMPIVLELVPEINQPVYFDLVQEYLEIDDSNDTPSEVAKGFLHVVFMSLIPATGLEKGLESLEAIRKQLLSHASEFSSQQEDILDVEQQIRALEADYHLNLADVEELQETRKYVTDKKEEWKKASKTYSDVLLSGASDMLLNPSSSSHYLDEREDRPLSHGPQARASQYHRSAKHSLFSSTTAKAVKGEVVKKPAIKKTSEGSGGEAHVGLYPNTFTYLRNRAMPRKSSKSATLEKPKDEETPPPTSPGEGDLYDASLAYKLMLSQRVAAHSQGLNHLTVGVYNDYPLVMVHFDLDAFLKEYKKGLPSDESNEMLDPTDGTKKAFTSFLMNYYMGLANYLAKNAGINITIVERSSFGFNTPSVAETGESFRINMGLMPPVYANVQAHALGLLNAQLDKLLKRKAPRDSSKHSLDTSSPYFDSKTGPKNKKRESINRIGDWLVFALFPTEVGNKPSIANAVRNRESLDFVNAQSFNLMAHFGGKIASLGIVMERLFQCMTVDKALSTKVESEETRYLYNVPGSKKDYQVDEQSTEQYKRLLALIQHHVLSISEESEDEEFQDRLESLVPLLNSINPHIELTLDLINEMLLIHVMNQVREEKDESLLGDGYGSESEVEDRSDQEEDDPEILPDADSSQKVRPKKRFLTGKKIITHNGMRALLSAIDSAVKVVYENQQKLQVDVQGAYYEMADALKASTVKAEVTEEPGSAHVIVRDINSCVTVGRKGSNIQGDLLASNATVWIIDTTSSTQKQMAALVNAFRSKGTVKILYLVSSGFKQEQFAADRNPYGTIRAFTDKSKEGKAMLNAILETTKTTDQPLAVTAHLYRRLMKRFGAVPTNRNLLANAQSLHNPSTFASGTTVGTEEWTAEDLGDELEDWSFLFDFDVDREQIEKRDALLAELKEALTNVLEQEDDPDADLADHSHHASEFIYAGVSSKEPAGKEIDRASRSWFQITPNPGGGDCLLHALAGRTMSFAEILEGRQELAGAAGNVIGESVSGSQIYQSLYQSGFLSNEMQAAIHGRHQVPTAVYQQAIRVPGLYAGEQEIRIYCHRAGVPVFIVTDEGELRKVTAGGTEQIERLAFIGEVTFKQRVRNLLEGGSIVLFKSPNHWERITGVK